ncbi:DUF4279 domain-containing protein [Paenibacillus antibioticophila]|uniref:DUF4279 domain-containing protein n=1 Tax=Paenibacillus antibioticophila TaxID=1274374 RepID=UPI0005C9C617|nr:DUF4279 domain-containing protein [Paenibacillus antibioticophila]
MSIRGNCALCFTDSQLNHSEISRILKLTPSTVIERGQVISEALKKKSDTSKWIYKEPILQGEEVSQTLTRLLERLDHEVINNVIRKSNNSCIAIYINSEMAQIGFELSNKAINLLSKFDLRLDIHILSFGLAED